MLTVTKKKRGMFGSDNPMWKGGRRVTNEGYILILQRDHHYTNIDGYILEHRKTWEETNKASLLPWAIVHHINGIKDDNRPENLIVLSSSKHKRHHNQGRKYHMKDMSGRFCYNCGSNTTYLTQGRSCQNPYYLWHRPPNVDGWECNNCYQKRCYNLKLQKNGRQTAS